MNESVGDYKMADLDACPIYGSLQEFTHSRRIAHKL